MNFEPTPTARDEYYALHYLCFFLRRKNETALTGAMLNEVQLYFKCI